MHGNSPADSDQLKFKDYNKTLLAELLHAQQIYGKDRVIAGDLMVREMTLGQLLLRAFVLKRRLVHSVKADPYVGVLLPNTLATMVTFFALHMMRAVPAMLNFTAGQASIQHACRIAQLKTIITSRTFIEKAGLDHLITALKKHCTIVYLEDERNTITGLDKLMGAAAAAFPRMALQGVFSATKPEDPAVVLYTSGSEGAPKGVVLSHRNILSNMIQSRIHLGLTADHIVFNALPLFHSFGLTVGMFMPLLSGMKTVLYPSPVHYKQIPEEIQKCKATIMLGTDTFYQGYARSGSKEQFASLKYAVAGAEKLKESTRLLWLNDFGIDILQGYGVTESSPVLSVNTLEDHHPGTVGRLVPDVEYTLEAVEGLDHGKRLIVKGPNIMLGYLKTDNPGVIQPGHEWYDTGDIVEIDAEGFITILGRAKRFAKIAGEMISLTVVEDLANELAADKGHAAIAIPDERRGEQIIMYTESHEITRDKLLALAKKKGVPEICLPKEIQRIDILPRLGSGKVDYMSLKDSMARSA
ncbi:MAG: AMP-binding protein [Alphaproteobacteria bacterium]